jgi:hypothetical protein
MTILKTRLAVLALGLAVTALASPSYAPGSRPRHQRGTRGRPSGVQLLQRLRLGLCLSGLYGSTRPSGVIGKARQ